MRVLDRADSIMEVAPDSALSILIGIDTASLAAGEERARYALLMSMALDKNYIDTEDDSLINIACQYYLNGPICREMILASFYSSRIGYNSGRYGDAIRDALRSVDIAGNLADTLWIARSNELVADIYNRTYAYDKSLAHRAKASEMYKHIGKKLNELYAKGDMTMEISAMKDHGTATALIDSLMHVAYDEFPSDTVLQACLISASLRVYTYAGEYDRAIDSWERRISYAETLPLTPSDYIDGAYIQLHFDNVNEAKRLAELTDGVCTSLSGRMNHIALKYSICRSGDDTERALEAADSLFAIIDNDIVAVASNGVLQVRGDYHSDVSDSQRKTSDLKSHIIEILASLLVGISFIFFSTSYALEWYRQRSTKRKDGRISNLANINIRLIRDIEDTQRKVIELIDSNKTLVSDKEYSDKKIEDLKKRFADLADEKDRLDKEYSEKNHEIDRITANRDRLIQEKQDINDRLKAAAAEQHRYARFDSTLVDSMKQLSLQIAKLEEKTTELVHNSNMGDYQAGNEIRRYPDVESTTTELLRCLVNTINSMCIQYMPENENDTVESHFKEKVKGEVSVLRTKKFAEGFISTINFTHDGIIDNIRSAVSGISEADLLFVAYVISGINQKMISIIMGIKYESVASKKKRLFKKITDSKVKRWEGIVNGKQ